jgi:archaetidylinositol phosphate synthase
MQTRQEFHGDKKLPLKSPLAKIERKFIDYWTPRFPRWIEGYHLTLMTILWSGGLILFGYLARGNPHWLWLSSVMLFLQWFTDSFDGALGRYRDTGIPKWGYHMDHFLDFVFMCSALIGYALLFDGWATTLFLILIPIFGALMVNSYLSFAATNEFKITFLGMGPTEIRLALILLNTAIILFGVGFAEKALPFVPVIGLLVLAVVVYRTQKYVWRIDMDDKRQRQERPE